jgi:hypothetical protein
MCGEEVEGRTLREADEGRKKIVLHTLVLSVDVHGLMFMTDVGTLFKRDPL